MFIFLWGQTLKGQLKGDILTYIKNEFSNKKLN
jgi:hypothetical protein